MKVHTVVQSDAIDARKSICFTPFGAPGIFSLQSDADALRAQMAAAHPDYEFEVMTSEVL